jgi:hypothetical protein
MNSQSDNGTPSFDRGFGLTERSGVTEALLDSWNNNVIGAAFSLSLSQSTFTHWAVVIGQGEGERVSLDLTILHGLFRRRGSLSFDSLVRFDTLTALRDLPSNDDHRQFNLLPLASPYILHPYILRLPYFLIVNSSCVKRIIQERFFIHKIKEVTFQQRVVIPHILQFILLVLIYPLKKKKKYFISF